MMSHPRQTALVTIALLTAPALAQDDCPPQWLTAEQGVASSVGREITINDRYMLSGDSGALSICPGGGDPFSCQAGAVFAFERFGSEWLPTQTIVPFDLEFIDGFGYAVALDPLNPDRFLTVTGGKRGQGELGYGHIYEHNGEQWVEAARLQRPPAGVAGSFGNAVALYGDTAIISQSAKVFRYREVGGQWNHEQTIERPSEVSDPGSFGYGNMELHGDWAFIGAHRDSTTGSPHGSPLHGSVLVYRRQPDGSLEYVQRLLPPDPSGPDDEGVQFGHGLDFDGHTLAVGAQGADREFEEQGVVYLYELDGDQWTLRQELVSSRPDYRAHFGESVSVDGDRLVAAHGRVTRRGALAFERGGDGVWREVAVLLPSGGGSGLEFGKVSAMHGRWAAFGASRESPGGAVYAFDLDCIMQGCEADLDADGALTIFDFLTYLNLFDAGDAQADFDGDGELTIFDFLAFGAAFDAGCE